MKKIFLLAAISLTLFSCEKNKNQVTKYEYYNKGYKYKKENWSFVHIEGSPYERGMQHGYLLADEYIKAYECYKVIMLHVSGFPMEDLKTEAIKSQKNKIPKELLDEMRGIADGVSKKGHKVDLDDIVAWNAWMDVLESWWPTVKSNFASYMPLSVGKRRERCSAFMATGSSTIDNKVVMAHSTFDEFWNVQCCNVILDIGLEKDRKLIMQTTPGYVASMTDFFINSSGIIGLETSLSGFNGYNINGSPSYVRQRLAMQYAKTIDEFVDIISKNNNGGNPATWLIADINTNEIAKFELGIKFQNLEKKKDGCFFGCNIAFDPYIRNLECDGEGFNDVRRHTGARRVRLPVLLEKYNSKIDSNIAKIIMSDHYDVYHKKYKAAANTVCAHYDEDPRESMSSLSSTNPNPYTPAGAVDCKITTSNLAKDMKLIGIFGRPCSQAFEKEKFLKEHPQWSWQKEYLLDRPHTNWVEFQSKK
ncbi:MAG: hypothetical protein K1060chlam5_00830 [Candidatus Anoxychlamydiales bacterium]|nr:hypothetical protein [Candidatus Anoxychlamydiales bacterium]